MPSSDPEWWIFLSTPYTHDRYFFLHTFLIYHRRTWYEITLFPLKGFYCSWKKSTLPATAIRIFTLTSNLHKVTSFFDVISCKNQHHLTTLICDFQYNQCITFTWFLSGPRWDNMGGIRFVGTGETRGYPYPVCKNTFSLIYGLQIFTHTCSGIMSCCDSIRS